MDLWIRSQNKKQIEKARSITIEHKQEYDKSIWGLTGTVEIEECYILVNGKPFGDYKTEQRAIEILDEIQDSMYDVYETMGSDGNVLVRHIQPKQDNFIVYQMPADDTPPTL